MWQLWGQSCYHSPLCQHQGGTGWGNWGRGRSQACVSLAGSPLFSRDTDEVHTKKNRDTENKTEENEKHNNQGETEKSDGKTWIKATNL